MNVYSTFRKYYLLLLVFLIPVTALRAQEINANVRVDRSRIDNASLTYLHDFAKKIEAYISDYTWTNDTFKTNEQINVTMQINLLAVDNDYNFNANIIIRSTRPVYDSPQQTTVFLYNDENWNFTYQPNSDFVHDDLQFDAIATLLDFYSYVVIGFDYDTFSALGGSPSFSEAQNLVSLGQTSSSAGWSRSANVPRNRAQLMADLLNPNYEPLRRASYRYYRQGLDLFLRNPEKARANLLEALKMLQRARRQTTSNLLLDTFFDAKYREMVSLFEDASTEVRLEAFDILSDIDPSHLNEYNKLQ